ncbi:hypothetical protein [Actinocorallia lasiicapitis]
MSDSVFQGIIGRILDKIEELNRQINAFFDALGDAISKLPGIVEGWAKAGWKKVTDAWNALMDKVNYYLKNKGEPGRLSNGEKRYSDDVQGKVSAEAGAFKADSGKANGMLADDKWKGDAADAYRQVLNPQSTALTTYANTAAAVGTALNEAAWAIQVFWGAVIAALIVLVTGIIAAIALAETVVGGIAAALAAIGVAVAAVGGAYLYAKATMSTQANVFRTQANANEAFPGPPAGSWPRATRDLATGATRA